MDVIERRVAWLTISVAIVLVYDATGAGVGYGSIGTWELIVFLGGIFGLGAAGVLLTCAVAPDWFRPFELDQRERFVFFAFLLLALAMISLVALSAHAAIHAHNHPSSFG